MSFCFISGALWGLDTVVLSIALSFGAFITPEALAAGALISAAFHDTFCAIWMFCYMAIKKRLSKTWEALHTKQSRVIMVGAALGGPIGMSAYVYAISTIGPGLTAIISSFYPAFGTLFAALFLKERIRPYQVVSLFVAIFAISYLSFDTAELSLGQSALPGIIAAFLCVIGWGSEAVLLAYGMKESTLTNEAALHIRESTSALLYLVLVLPLFGMSGLATKLVLTQNTAVISLAALFGTASYLFYYKGISKIGASRAMAGNISYSAWSVVFGVVLLGHIPTLTEIICCVVILAATILAASDLSELRKKA